MNKIDRAKICTLMFEMAKKYNMDLTFRYNTKRGIDTFSFTKFNPTIKRLKIEIGMNNCVNFSVYKFNTQSSVKEYLHQNCKIDDVENILYKCGNDWDVWENFVNNLMLHLKKIKDKQKNDKIVIDK